MSENKINNQKEESIKVVGARVHNLKNITVKIPRGKMTVVTGLSGSGKSSLAFDTIYAEGRRRYMESIAGFAKQFLPILEKPDVDYIEGLSPAISIDQKSAARTPRSTVGTMSEIYDYLRLLFAKIGHPHSEDVTISHFSFNSPEGACPLCQGLGMRLTADPKLVVPNPVLTLGEGAIWPWAKLTGQSLAHQKELSALGRRYGFDLDTPVIDMTPAQLKIILYGEGEKGEFEGAIPNLERKYRETDSDYLRNEIEKYMVKKICDGCGGKRLNPAAIRIKVSGYSITEISDWPLKQVIDFLKELKLSKNEKELITPILKEIETRLNFLIGVGLEYLTLNRGADTLAGGEAQRIRLATQLGSSLTGILYVLDEPSIGLHTQDLSKLLASLKSLKDMGNTLLIVEHNRETMLIADHLIDVGPGAGERGGKIVAAGTPEQVMRNSDSLTGQYLSGKKEIPVPAKRNKSNGKYLEIKGANAYNLKNIDARFPLGLFIGVAGVSGSGKSTLISEILAKALSQHFFRAKEKPASHKTILGLNNINKVINVDQSPIGLTPRSNPATYSSVFTPIRELFSSMSKAATRGFKPSHFSFNLKGGRCENCRGDGGIKIEMYFLPDTYSICEECKGSRYKKEILEIQYKGKSIADVLEMTVSEAKKNFAGHKHIIDKLSILEEVGLGYVKLGQPATTLSGGEAQRVKLATELSRKDTGRTLYILDEPTTGLHFEDTRKLLEVLRTLVLKGNTVIVVEHDLDVIKSVDWVIDMGPGGGVNGGKIIAEGSPEQIAKNPASVTGKYLKEVLR